MRRKRLSQDLGALDDPAAGAEAGLALERLGFLAAGADVGGEAELGDERVHLGEVEPLSRQIPCGDSGVGSGRSIGIDAIVARQSLKSFRFAPAGSIPSGTPAPSVRRLRFAPF
jgi:hypothetical protein